MDGICVRDTAKVRGILWGAAILSIGIAVLQAILTGYGHWFAVSLVAVAALAYMYGTKGGLLSGILIPLLTSFATMFMPVTLAEIIRDNTVFLFISLHSFPLIWHYFMTKNLINY